MTRPPVRVALPLCGVDCTLRGVPFPHPGPPMPTFPSATLESLTRSIFAAGTLRNCGHTGRLGEYAERAAAEKLAFFGAVNSHGSGRRVAPPGGTEGRISTNPICLGTPTSTDPVVLDFGTSVVAEGKVRV